MPLLNYRILKIINTGIASNIYTTIMPAWLDYYVDRRRADREDTYGKNGADLLRSDPPL